MLSRVIARFSTRPQKEALSWLVQEIARDDVWNVIIEERSPGLRRRLTGASHVLGHRPLGHLMSQ